VKVANTSGKLSLTLGDPLSISPKVMNDRRVRADQYGQLVTSVFPKKPKRCTSCITAPLRVCLRKPPSAIPTYPLKRIYMYSWLADGIREMPSQLPRYWKCLERQWGASYKCFEVLPVLTVSSQRVEARRIAAEYFFSHWLVPRAPYLDGMDNAPTWNKHQFFQR
jgi:hypothetical protein